MQSEGVWKMSQEKVKIIEARYNVEKDLAKIKVKKLDTGKEITWAIMGDDFDSFIAQITGKQLKYYAIQREMLCENIIGIEFLNQIEFDIDSVDVDKAKDKSSTELQHTHDLVDRYPFYEIQQEAIEESIRGTSSQEEDK